MTRIKGKDAAQAAQDQMSAGLDHAREAATQVGPLAKRAGTTAAQGVREARAWTAPRVREARDWATPRVEQGVRGARAWTAPRVEQAAHSLQENVAPKVSGMLEAAAHRIEPGAAAVKRRLWPRLMAGFAVLAAAAGAITAVAKWRRAAQPPDDVMTGEASEAGQDAVAQTETAADQEADAVMAETGSNGKSPQR
jgi:hypothetical protein